MSKPDPSRPWVIAIGAFAIAHATNTIFFAVDIPIGWGLRGSHTAGRPTASDVRMELILEIACVVALVINLGLPIGCAIARKWYGLVGVALAWAVTPFAWLAGLVIDAVLLRIAF